MQLRLIDLFCGWTASFRLSDKANERIWLLFCYLGMKHRQRAKHHVPTWTISSSAFKWRVAAWWLLYEVASYFWPLWGLNTVMYRNDVWLVVVYFCWTGIVWCLLRFSEVLFLLIDFSQSRQCIIFNLLWTKAALHQLKMQKFPVDMTYEMPFVTHFASAMWHISKWKRIFDKNMRSTIYLF